MLRFSEQLVKIGSCGSKVLENLGKQLRWKTKLKVGQERAPGLNEKMSHQYSAHALSQDIHHQPAEACAP